MKYKMNKKQLELVTGGEAALDPNQEECLAELEKKLAEFMNTRQGQRLDLPERLPDGSYIGTGLGFHPSYDPNALQ